MTPPRVWTLRWFLRLPLLISGERVRAQRRRSLRQLPIGSRRSPSFRPLILSNAEIAMLDGYIVVYKFIQDLHFFVTGGDDENELIIATVLQGFFDAVGLLLRIVLETEPSVIASKVAANSLDGATSLSEQLIHKN
ncbi:hypothetical protein MUK42_11933 [Musa troglodytarum]|uniref:Coatomer subunit zeta n=1 Tax=Musa troglodytarum TaxID=320322 RepID=A0A9E7GUV2_9LILI|nr:hypothetical protein MUK42_11933 [Musa troglodytarum]